MSTARGSQPSGLFCTPTLTALRRKRFLQNQENIRSSGFTLKLYPLSQNPIPVLFPLSQNPTPVLFPRQKNNPRKQKFLQVFPWKGKVCTPSKFVYAVNILFVTLFMILKLESRDVNALIQLTAS